LDPRLGEGCENIKLQNIAVRRQFVYTICFDALSHLSAQLKIKDDLVHSILLCFSLFLILLIYSERCGNVDLNINQLNLLPANEAECYQ